MIMTVFIGLTGFVLAIYFVYTLVKFHRSIVSDFKKFIFILLVSTILSAVIAKMFYLSNRYVLENCLNYHWETGKECSSATLMFLTVSEPDYTGLIFIFGVLVGWLVAVRNVTRLSN